MPWQTESSQGDEARDNFKYKPTLFVHGKLSNALDRYQYHPGGNPKNPPKDAPSALHSVIVPNVNLPKVCRLQVTLGEWTNCRAPLSSNGVFFFIKLILLPLGAAREVQQVGEGRVLKTTGCIVAERNVVCRYVDWEYCFHNTQITKIRFFNEACIPILAFKQLTSLVGRDL
jgi:hypothetical protein